MLRSPFLIGEPWFILKLGNRWARPVRLEGRLCYLALLLWIVLGAMAIPIWSQLPSSWSLFDICYVLGMIVGAIVIATKTELKLTRDLD